MAYWLTHLFSGMVRMFPEEKKIYFKDRRVMHNLYPERGTRARRGASVMLLL